MEQGKSRDLAAQVSRLHEKIVLLESEAVDRRLYIDGLEAEIGSAENEKHIVTEKLGDLQIQFTNANREADETLRAVQEDFNTRELQFKSTTLTHEEDINNLSKEKDRLTNELCQKEKEIKSLRKHYEDDVDAFNKKKVELLDEIQQKETEKASLAELHETLKVSYSNLEHDLGLERLTISQQVDEISRLNNQSIDLEIRLHNTEAELQAVNTQLSELRSCHQELIRSSEEILHDLKIKYENDLELTVSKAGEEYKRLSDELQDAIYNGKRATDAYENTRQELQIVQNTLDTLEANTERLNHACSEKDVELDELRAWRSRVLVSMGVVTTNPLPGPALNNSPNDPRTPRQHRHRKSAVQIQDFAPKALMNIQTTTSPVIENVVNTPITSSDSSRDGSTPKRAKPRASSKDSNMNTLSIQNSSYSSRLLSKKLLPKRPALRTLSPNRRHTTVGFMIPEKDNDGDAQCNEAGKWRGRSSDTDDIQTSFDMDAFLAASTPFTPGNFTCGTG